MIQKNKLIIKGLAQKVLTDNYIFNSSDIDLVGLMGCYNILYREKPLVSFDGYLQRSKGYGVITVNSKVKNHHQKRFILAHELGHWFLHEDIPTFSCKPEDFKLWNSKTLKIESEANMFASEFLMPTELFRTCCKEHDFSKKTIATLSDKFNVSITATAIRYSQIGTEPVCVVFSKNRQVKWAIYSDDFIFAFYDSKFRTPVNSMTDYFYDGEMPEDDEVSIINAMDWFHNDHTCTTDYFLSEIIFPMPTYDSCLTILSLN